MKSASILFPFIALLVFNSNSVLLNNSLVKNDTYNPPKNQTCELCLVLVNLIDHEVKLGNKTISDITNIIDDICHIIGVPAGKECSFIVKEIKNITNFISKRFNNTQLCDKLHLCNTTIIKNNLIS